MDKLTTINILSHAGDVYITEDEDDLTDIGSEPNLGATIVAKCQIILDADCAPSFMQSVLFHEVKEFIRVLLGANYLDHHEYFTQFAEVEYGVLKANKEILFGDKLAELLEGVKHVSRVARKRGQGKSS